MTGAEGVLLCLAFPVLFGSGFLIWFIRFIVRTDREDEIRHRERLHKIHHGLCPDCGEPLH